MAGRADAQGTGNYVDFQEYVDFQLRKTRDQIRTTDLLTGATVAAVLVLGYLLLFIVADQWLFPRGVPVAIRWIGLLIWGAVVGGWVAMRLGLPLSRKVSGLFAAKQVEQVEPELRSNLLNWVDLQRAGRPVDPAVLRAIERQAAVQLSKMDVTDAVDHRPLLRSGYLLLAVVLFGCLYAVLSPKPLGPTLARVIPFTEVAPPTRTVIREVQPGDARVLARTPLAITVDLAGVIPERVELRYTTADRKFRDEPLPLQPEGTAGTRFRGILSGESGQGLLQDLSYHIVAGDALSPTYRVTVDQPPSATIRELRITPPPYTGQTPETLTGGNFEALEGSTIELAADVPIPVQSAVIEFLDEAQGKPNGEQEPVTVTDGTKLTANWTLERRRDGTYAPFYRIQCRTEDGRTDPAPIIYQLKIIPDQPPTIALIAPERDLDLPANAVVPLLAEAADPDFELGPINLVVQRKGKVIARETLSQGKQQAVRVQHDLSLKPLALEPGDEISFFLTAQDNRQPERNLAQTPPLKIRILAPASDAAVQQQLAEEKTRQQDQLAQLDQPTGEGREPEPGTDNPAEMDPANDTPSPTETEPNPGDDPMTDPPREESTEGPAGTEGSGTAAGQGAPNSGETNPGDATGQSAGTGRNQTGNGPSESKPLSANGEDDQEALERILQRNRAMSEGNRGTAGGQAGTATPQTKPPSQPSPSDSPQPSPNPTEGTSPAPRPNDPAEASSDNANGAGKSGPSPPQAGPKTPRPGTKTPDPTANPSPTEPSAEPMPQPTDPAAAGSPMPQDPANPNSAANNTTKGTNSPKNSRGTPENSAANPADMPSEPAADPTAPSDQPTPEAGNSPKGSQPATTPDKNTAKPPTGTPAGNDAGTEPGEMPEGIPSTPGDTPNKAPQTPTSPKSPVKPGDVGAKPATPGANENPGETPAEPMANDDPTGDNPSAPNGEAPQSPTEKPGTKGQPGPGNKEPGKAPNKTPQPSGDEPQGPGEPSSEPAMEPQEGQPPGRDGSPNAGETTPPGPGRSKGQRSEQPQTGEKGSSAQSSEGQPGSGESGPGDTTQQPGNRSQGSSNSGKNGAGSKPSQGAGKPSQGGGQPGSDGSASDSAGGQPGSSSPSGKTGNKGGSPSGGNSASASEGDSGMPEDNANPGQGTATPGKSPKAPMNGAPSADGTDPPAGGDETSAENGSPKTPAGTSKGPGKNAPGKTPKGAEPMTESGAEGPGQAGSAPRGPSPDKGPGDQPGEGNPSPEGGGGASPKSPQKESPAKPEGDGQQGGESGQKGGGEQPGKEGGGKPSSGSGKPSQGGKEGGGKGGGESGGQAPGQGGQPAAGGPTGAPSSSSGGGGVGGPAGTPSAGPGAGPGPEGQETTPVEPPAAGDPANLDYNKQATELVLQRLQQNIERGDVDPKLLEELGWTEEQLQRFVGRLQTALEETAKPAETPQDQARRVQFEEMLKSLDVHRAGSVRTGGDQPSREVEQTDVRRAPVPAEYRRAWENYTRSLSKTPKPKP